MDTNVSKVEVVSKIFIECEFYVINTNKKIITKHKLEKLIVANGGTKVQNFLITNTHLIASKEDLFTRNILQKYDVNIIKPDWVLDCVKSG